VKKFTFIVVWAFTLHYIHLTIKDIFFDATTMAREEIQHPWPDNSIAGGFFLVFTNLILAWIVTDLAYRYRWDLSLVLLCTMIASILYHSCRAGFACILRFRDHQVTDHVFVYFSLLYIASKLIVRRGFFHKKTLLMFPQLIVHARIAVFFVFILVAILCNMYNPESGWVAILCFGAPSLLVVLSAVIVNEPVFYNTTNGVIGTILFVCSLTFYHFAPHSWYDWAHSIWHVLSMLSVYFIVFSIEPPMRLRVDEHTKQVDWETGRVVVK